MAQIRNANMVCAHAFLNIKAIPTKDVGQNVLSAMTVPETKRASETNVLIHVLELVDKMLNATFTITFLCARVYLVSLEMLLFCVLKSEVIF